MQRAMNPKKANIFYNFGTYSFSAPLRNNKDDIERKKFKINTKCEVS